MASRSIPSQTADEPASPLPLLDVPLAAHAEYLALLADNVQRLESVHLSLGPELIPDARVPAARPAAQELGALMEALDSLAPVPAYALLNSSFHAPEALTVQGLAPLVSALDRLASLGRLQGVVVADFYLLHALERTAPSLCAELQAVPSVNCRLDSLPRIALFMERIERTAFRFPARLVLDRSLNRRLSELKDLRRGMEQRWPGLRVLLLANEGCLLHCPFKPAHDALIALAHLGPDQECTFALNRDLGCVSTYFKHPGEIFRSPLIRPEDTPAYAGLCHGLKLCGRTRDPAVLTRIVTAYIKGRYAGNMLDLADSMEGLARALHVDNQSLPKDLVRLLGDCPLDCASCGLCRDLAKSHVRRLPPAPDPFPGPAPPHP